MATVINNPDGGDREVVRSGGGMGTLIGAIVLILILILFFVYGLPALRRGGSSTSSGRSVSTPTTSSGASGTASGSVSGSTGTAQ